MLLLFLFIIYGSSKGPTEFPPFPPPSTNSPTNTSTRTRFARRFGGSSNGVSRVGVCVVRQRDFSMDLCGISRLRRAFVLLLWKRRMMTGGWWGGKNTAILPTKNNVPSLKLTVRPGPKTKGSSSNHQFSGAKMWVFQGGWQQKKLEHEATGVLISWCVDGESWLKLPTLRVPSAAVCCPKNLPCWRWGWNFRNHHDGPKIGHQIDFW